jgi:hypothetical protein
MFEPDELLFLDCVESRLCSIFFLASQRYEVNDFVRRGIVVTRLARHYHSFKRSDAELTRRFLEPFQLIEPCV